MSTGEQTNNPSPAAIRDEVRRTIQQLNEMATTERNFDRFCDTVLRRVVNITGAHGALFWQINGDRKPQLTHQSGKHPSKTASQLLAEGNEKHTRAVLEVVDKELPMGLKSDEFTSADSQSDDADQQRDESFLMLFSPIYNRTKKCCGTLELLQRGDISPQAQEGYLRFLTQVSKLFLRWSEEQNAAKPRTAQPQSSQRPTQAAQANIRTPQSSVPAVPGPVVQQPIQIPSATVAQDGQTQHQKTTSWNDRLEFISEVHRSIEKTETCYSIANEARRLLGCDRVSVGTWNGSKVKITAISSQDRFDNRANVVRLLSNVATASVSADSEFWITGSTEGMAPEVARKINEYLDESHSRTLAVIPLFARPPETPDLEMKSRRKEETKKLGVIIFEYFDADVPEAQIEDTSRLIVNQSQLALENARKHGEIFLLPLWQKLGWLQKFLFRDHYSKTMTGLGCLAFFILLLFFFPKELKMKVDGVLHPTVRRTIFAQTEGVIRQIMINERQDVTSGEKLLQLENRDLDIQILDSESQLKLLDVQISNASAKLSAGQRDPLERADISQSIEQFEKQKEAIEAQLELMYEKKSFLTISSPIAGTIITPQPRRRYQDFPVTPNLALLEVADLGGPWQLELKIPQGKVAYIDRAFKNNGGQPLDVVFKIGTDPNLNLKGTVANIDQRAVPSETGAPDFRAIVEIDSSQLAKLKEELRSGAGATAKIECGTHALGFVWFYQIYDFMRTKVFF